MFRAPLSISLGLGAVLLTSSAAFAAELPVGGPIAGKNTPRFTSSARKLGPVDPTNEMDVSIWLTPHNKADMDAVAKDLYNPSSPRYRHWLTKSEFVSRYAPTAAEGKAVQDFFTSNGLKIVTVGPDNFFVRAHGTAAAVSKAFHVTLSNYEYKGKTVRANESDPYVSGAAGPLVAAVSGLDTMEFTHPLVTTTSGLNKQGKGGGVTTAKLSADIVPAAGPVFNDNCFPGTTSISMSNQGTTPKAKYVGNGYTPNVATCGYVPEDIHEAYNLGPLYSEGYAGQGQTIVIVDWCGSPTILADANAFSKQFNLPALNSSNFQIINTPTPSYCAAPDAEINLDVEWSHAIAPRANIDLVVPPSPSFQDINEAVFYAVDYQLGNVISNSYGAEEIYVDPSTLITGDLINEAAAILGISNNYSTGDYGDFTFGYPQYNPASVSFPADSYYATAVGGTSLALTPTRKIAWQAGWGTDLNLLWDEGYVEDPPANNSFFNFGSGGGSSQFFLKPPFQSGLKGNFRKLPDISWVADPYTGAYIAISEPFAVPELQYEAIGGTSLSTPMFSALWAIANQEAGTPLGQAAAYVYSMPSSAVTDILPISSPTNVTGTVVDAHGTTSYSALSLAHPDQGVSTFISALWNYPLYDDTTYLLTFGTDSGLAVTPGWDDVTGVGVPTGKGFADYFHP